MVASERYEITRRNSLHLRGQLAGEWWPRYDALLGGTVSGGAEWQHSFGVDPLAPVVSLAAAANATEVKETERRGIGTGVTASVRKRFNDFTRATVSHEVAWFDARNGTFDRGASETAIEIDRDLTPVTRLRFAARFRDGDVVTYASGLRPDLEALATSRVALDTFGRPMTAYRVDARMWSGRIALVRALDETSALVVAYERRHARREALRFGEHLLSVALVHQF
jgi:hypothetical protein